MSKQSNMVIDASYFNGVLSIGANVMYSAPNAGGITASANRDGLQKSIDVFEREYVRRMFGSTMYSALYAYLNRADAIEVEERWETLLSLLRADDGGVSPVAAYVYFRILETNNAHVTESGVATGVGENVTSPVPLQVKAWGLMVSANIDVRAYVRDNFTDYNPPYNPLMFERVNSLGL